MASSLCDTGGGGGGGGCVAQFCVGAMSQYHRVKLLILLQYNSRDIFPTKSYFKSRKYSKYTGVIRVNQEPCINTMACDSGFYDQ